MHTHQQAIDHAAATGGVPAAFGRTVAYTSDGRNGPPYQLPAVIVLTADNHVDGYPIPKPDAAAGEVDLYVMSPLSAYHETAVPYDPDRGPRTWAWPDRA